MSRSLFKNLSWHVSGRCANCGYSSFYSKQQYYSDSLPIKISKKLNRSLKAQGISLNEWLDKAINKRAKKEIKKQLKYGQYLDIDQEKMAKLKLLEFCGWKTKRSTNIDFLKSKGFYDSPEWRLLRYKFLKENKKKCVICGEIDAIFHVDHKKPRSVFPLLALDYGNLQILCRECNLGKSNIFF